MVPSNIIEKRVYHTAFILFTCMVIIPVWWYPGFITADGPCHTYNASVLKDFFTGNAAFHQVFYAINTALEPNWFSHISLAALMLVFSPATADKILITACVLNFAFGFRYFMASVRPGSNYLAIGVFPFIWQFAMFMGFYNYMFSIGCMFWVTGYWLNIHTRLTPRRMLLLSVACVVIYFMHLLGIFLSGVVMGLIAVVSYRKENVKATGKEVLQLLVVMLPAIFLTLNYVVHNSNSFSNEYKAPYADLWNNLKDIFSLQSIHPGEYKLTVIISKVIALYFLYALSRLVINRVKDRLWVMPVTMLTLLMLSYFFAYESMLGGSYIRYRLECLIYLFAIITLATVAIPILPRILFVLFFSVTTIIYFTCRWGAFKDANDMVTEFRSLRPYIKDKSVVLPLKYVDFPARHSNGQVIAAKVLLFSHVAEAIHEQGKQLLFLENYEANTGYFPLLWKDEVNPFVHLGAGLETSPPDVDIAGYNREHHRVDYIVIWGRQGDILQNPTTQSVADTINKYYNLVHVTPLYKIELYGLKEN